MNIRHTNERDIAKHAAHHPIYHTVVPNHCKELLASSFSFLKNLTQYLSEHYTHSIKYKYDSMALT